MVFEAGLFYTLLGIAFILLMIKVQYREFLIFVSAGIFFVLSFVLYTNNDVVFFISTTDGINVINQTNIIIGDRNVIYNQNAMFLASIFGVIGIVLCLIGLVSWITWSPQKRND